MRTAVVLSLFDGAAFVRETLRCVRAQTRLPDEVVVVDDGSTDGSPDLVAREPGVRLLHNPVRGAAAARGHGFAATTAERVAFLDQDDLWHPRHLERLHEVLDARPDAVAAVARVAEFRDPARPVLAAEDRGPLTEVDPWVDFPFSNPIRTPSAVLLLRRPFERAGGFEPAHTGVGDFLLWLRLSLEGPLVLHASPTVGKRLHGASQTAAFRADPFAQLDRVLRAGHAALETRVARGGAVRRDLEGRLSALEDGVVVARAALCRATALAADGPVSRLEALARASPRLARAVVARVVRSVAGGGSSSERRRRRAATLHSLHEGWPGAGPRMRRAIRRYAAEKRWPAGEFLRDLVRGRLGRAGYALRLLPARAFPGLGR